MNRIKKHTLTGCPANVPMSLLNKQPLQCLYDPMVQTIHDSTVRGHGGMYLAILLAIEYGRILGKQEARKSRPRCANTGSGNAEQMQPTDSVTNIPDIQEDCKA